MERRPTVYLSLAALAVAVVAVGQTPAELFRAWNGNEDENSSLVRTEGSGIIDENVVKTAREVMSHSTGTPMWENPRGFEADVFTFTRAIFKVGPNSAIGYGRGRRLGWWVDFPDADLNLSYRLQQMTSMKVDPHGRVLKLTNPDLHNYPFLFMEHPGYMRLRDPEVEGLRKYLQTGGVLLVIDFWNSTEWSGFAEQMARVLPGREWTELSTDHPLFNCVYDLRVPMQSLQVPTMQFWNRNHNWRDPNSQIQIYRGEGAEKMSVRALLDDKQRIMVLAVHNSDVSDGWEREGEDSEFFSVFSEKVSYPLGINLIFYLMTH